MTRRYIAYFRVSTDRQGRSGLGLEAQRTAVLDYLNGGAWELVETFTEVESGRHDDRPELEKALAACRRHKAILVIAKLDRLARSVAFIANLMDSGVEFTAVDMPHANRFTLHIFAAVADHERHAISSRTKAALAAAKARGKALGWSIPGRQDEQRQAARQAATARRENADRHAAKVWPVLEAIRAAGATTLKEQADALNARGVRTARGGIWHPATVRNLRLRVEAGTAARQADAAD